VPLSADPDQGTEVTQEDPNLRDLLVRHTQAGNRHDLDALMRLFAEDWVFEASGGDEVCGKRHHGKGEVRSAFTEVFEMMPNTEWGNGSLYDLGPGHGVTEWTLTGTLPDGRRWARS